MAEHSRFFDSLNPLEPDRVYTADEFTSYFRALITTGIMKGTANMLKVETSGSNMNTTVDTGTAFLIGRQYENDTKLSLTHEVEALGKSRLDRVVIRLVLDMDARYIKAFVKKGVAGSSPVVPPLERTGDVYEISLAQVKVVGGQTYINVIDVTDERGNPDVCPWAGSKLLPNFDDSSIGQPDGIAQLGSDGKLLATQLRLNNTLISTSTTEAATANAVKQVNDKIIASEVAIGQGATAKYHSSVAVGGQSEAGSSGTALGQGAKTTGIGVALGRGSLAGNSTGAGATAIGHSAYATGENSAAIGHSTSSPNKNEGVIGSPVNSPNGPSIWRVEGSFSVTGAKQFEMPHPHPDKKSTHVIRHASVESPTAGDTLYRFEVEATSEGETVILHLPDYFESLNSNVDVWVNPHLHFGRAFGIVEGDNLKVTCEKKGIYRALVIGTRNDEHIQDWGIKGVEREIGESWTGETYSYEVDEITEIREITGGY